MVLVAVAVIDYGIYRVLRPDFYPGDTLLGGLAHDLDRAFLHFDFGRACPHPGCPPVRTLWARSWTADVYLLVGGLALGLAGGIAGAVFCASRPRSRATRVVESVGVLFYSLPVYLFGFAILLLFEPTFGALPLPFFFHPLDYEAPFADPWAFLRAMVVPWIVVAAPFAAVVLRLMQAGMLEALESDYARTAAAKGLSRRRVIRRHAAPPSYPDRRRAAAGGRDHRPRPGLAGGGVRTAREAVSGLRTVRG